jgi:hypothetical protein
LSDARHTDLGSHREPICSGHAAGLQAGRAMKALMLMDGQPIGHAPTLAEATARLALGLGLGCLFGGSPFARRATALATFSVELAEPNRNNKPE